MEVVAVGVLQDKSALGAANIVAQDHIARPFAGQLGAVGDPQGSALGTLICANATGAWGWEGRVTDAHLATANLTSLHDVLAPSTQIDLGHRVAGHAGISK